MTHHFSLLRTEHFKQQLLLLNEVPNREMDVSSKIAKNSSPELHPTLSR
jgi:hypothetical protein